ncbi:ULP-PROTEASE domain-containing protein [Aphelenchoides fujianensis]|nr:ULP-PROTEASE domain-containing protein [Aphelenchoides fujianensis]
MEIDPSEMLDVRLLAELSARSSPTPSASIPQPADLNESVDFDARDLYLRAVMAENPEMDFEAPPAENEDPLAEARKNWTITRAESRCIKSELSAGLNYVRSLRINQELRDKKLQNILKASERRQKWRAFDIRLDGNLRHAKVCQEEGRLRHLARVNEQIQLEKEYRRRLGLPVFVPLFFTIEENLFPDLDANALDLVRRASLGKDLKTLSGLNWLNDEVINFYLSLIARRAERDGSLPRTYAFNTFFLKTLQQRGFAGVKRWTRRSGRLLVIDFKAQEINYYDSLGGTNPQSYLREEHKDKKGSDFDLSGWTAECKKNIPRQMNGSDCGVFTCVFAEFSSRRSELKFDQRIMPYYRQRMVYEICQRALMI